MEAAHELSRLEFVLTVVIFHVVFNHIVITKHQDHFSPCASLYRVPGCCCAKLFLWSLHHETCNLVHISTHIEAQGLPQALKKLGLRPRVENLEDVPAKRPTPQEALLQVRCK